MKVKQQKKTSKNSAKHGGDIKSAWKMNFYFIVEVINFTNLIIMKML